MLKMTKMLMKRKAKNMFGAFAFFMPAIILCLYFAIRPFYTVLASPALQNPINDSDIKNSKFNMSYIHYGDKSKYLQYVANTKGSLNEVSPNYYNLSNTGNLIVSPLIDKSFIDEMHKQGIKVVPFLSNNWDRTAGRLALNKRLKLSGEIADSIEKYNLDGINIDIENLTENDREKYVDFIRLLRNKLPAEKTIAVAVAANPKGLTSGWHGSYDYKELAKYSDYLMVMTYDEHYSGGPSGPVASIGFVEKSIKYALENVPAEKIVLGIPFYGRIWRNGTGLKGQGISLRVVENFIAGYGANVSFNSLYSSPKAIMTIKSSDKKPIFDGNEIKAGTYTIWYENEDSIKRKLTLVKKYNLKGSGSWSLGQETPDIWEYYNLWLNGYYYADCEGHWAKNDIIYALNNGWLNASDNTKFEPDKSITRAEAVVAIVNAFELKNLRGKDESGENKIVFNDISRHWARDEIEIAVQNRIITGKPNGSFLPDDPITREEICVMLDRALSAGRITVLASSRGNDFYTDISRDNCTWSYDSIMRVSQLAIFSNSQDNKFNPKAELSRAEMADLLCNMFKK